MYSSRTSRIILIFLSLVFSFYRVGGGVVLLVEITDQNSNGRLLHGRSSNIRDRVRLEVKCPRTNLNNMLVKLLIWGYLKLYKL